MTALQKVGHWGLNFVYFMIKMSCLVGLTVVCTEKNTSVRRNAQYFIICFRSLKLTGPSG